MFCLIFLSLHNVFSCSLHLLKPASVCLRLRLRPSVPCVCLTVVVSRHFLRPIIVTAVFLQLDVSDRIAGQCVPGVCLCVCPRRVCLCVSPVRGSAMAVPSHVRRSTCGGQKGKEGERRSHWESLCSKSTFSLRKKAPPKTGGSNPGAVSPPRLKGARPLVTGWAGAMGSAP